MLTIELVPKSSWYTNVRSEVSQKEWDLIRKSVYKRAGYRCEVCGGRGTDHPVECHEVWEYDDDNHVQTLQKMVALCPSCHEVKHIGRASLNGNRLRAAEHLAEVNGWTLPKAKIYIQKSFEKWRERSQHEWTVDTSILESQYLTTA